MIGVVIPRCWFVILRLVFFADRRIYAFAGCGHADGRLHRSFSAKSAAQDDKSNHAKGDVWSNHQTGGPLKLSSSPTSDYHLQSNRFDVIWVESPQGG